jgi:fatty acid desaturase
MLKDSMMNAQEARSEQDPLGWCEAVAQGHFIRESDLARYPIPNILNVCLAAVQITAAFALLGAASHAKSLWVTGLLAVVFSLIMQLGFCLAHEAAHAKLHAISNVNEGLGILLFSLFPGSYHLFETSHLTHHRRNRSDAELEDYVLPKEIAWLKRASYYLILCGMFWVLTPISFVALAMMPSSIKIIQSPGEDTGALARYLQFLNSVDRWRIRRDLLVTGIIWTVASLILHFKFFALAVCYGLFAFCWASQQYIYHVRTPRHAVLGALDLHLWRPLELLYLHFNYHLTHHVAAWVPWIYLPKIAAQQPTRTFLNAYLEQWRPPQPLEKAWPPRFQVSGPLPVQYQREP